MESRQQVDVGRGSMSPARASVAAVCLLLVNAAAAGTEIKGLHAPAPAPELAEKLMLFGQFVGDWECDVVRIKPDGSRQTGKCEWHFGWVLDGRAVQDVWIARYDDDEPGAPVSGYGTTLRLYDPATDAWQAVWMSARENRLSVFKARQVGDEIILEGNEQGRPYRWIFSDITPGSFRWRSVGSPDGGKSWRPNQEMAVRRVAGPEGPMATAPSKGGPGASQGHGARFPEEMHRLHQDTKAYIAMLEEPARDSYQKPQEVIQALGLREGEVIADVGSGSGYFTVRFAAQVGEKGRVYGVDIDPEMIRHLNRRVRDAGLRNVQAILADPDDPLLADGSIDRFVIVDTWHHIEDQAKYVVLMKKMLKPGGQVVLIDFHKREMPVHGPPMEMRISREDLLRQMEANGFILAKEHTFLPYQYFLVFEVRS